MNGPWDRGDWFVLLHANAAGIAATTFLFLHPDPINFATWGTFCGVLFSLYHWFLIRDSKTPDASEGK